MNESAFSETLQCSWSGWRVIGSQALAVDLPEFNCTDMTGAIATAQALMPEVARIIAYCNGLPDTLYKLERGKWNAYGFERLAVMNGGRL